MNFIYDLKDNYQFILDNLSSFTPQDLYVFDINFFNFCNEYFYTFVICDLPSPQDDDKTFIKLLNYGEQFFKDMKIGSGSYGSIFKYGNKVLKIEDFQSSESFSILLNAKSHGNISIFDPIFEGVSSIFFNNIIKKYSPCFSQTYGVYITSFKEAKNNTDKYPWDEFFNSELEDGLVEGGNIVSVLMEQLNSIPIQTYVDEMYYILYIVLHNIYIGQSKCKFVHGDLHLLNIMCKDYPLGEDINLVYTDAIITIESKGWIPIIIDFGFSSFIHNNKRFSSKDTAITQSGSAFDPYFDCVKLFGRMIFTLNLMGIDYEELEECFMKSKHPIDYYLDGNDEVKSDIYNNKDIRNISDILSRLLDKIPHKIQNIQTDLITQRDIVSEIIKVNEDTIINNFSIYKNIKYKTNVIPNFKEARYSDVLNIHLVEINKIDKNHMFVSKCCKQNVVDFSHQNDGSIVINGNFFNMNNMGNFYNNIYGYRFEEEHENFKRNLRESIDDYGMIFIEHNRIYIDKEISFESISDEPDNFLLSGPLLVIDGIKTDIDNRIFETYKRDKKEIYKYSCSKSFDKENTFSLKDQNKNKYIHCSNISPGELFHLGNPNPRTILATKGDTTYFIVIEGRTKEYRGASIEQMYDFLVNYLKVDDAINLDGGASSCMIWSKDGKLYSPMNIYYKKTIGNVIALVQK